MVWLWRMAGGAHWWGTVTGRLRAQSVWNQPSTREGKPHRALKDAGAYSLSCRVRASLPAGATTLRAGAELDSLAGVLPLRAGGAKQLLRARASLHSAALLPGHELTAEASFRERAGASQLTQSVAAASRGYCQQGRCAAAAVTSAPGIGPLRYRVGVFAEGPEQGGANLISVRAQVSQRQRRHLSARVPAASVRAQAVLLWTGLCAPDWFCLLWTGSVRSGLVSVALD